MCNTPYSDILDVQEYHGMKEVSIIDKLKLEPITERKFRKHTMENSCSLRDAVEYKLTADFKRGRAYYEFAHKKENISEDKEVIFMDKVSKAELNGMFGCVDCTLNLPHRKQEGISLQQLVPVSSKIVGYLVKV